jgi:hypothetical protein
MRGTCEVPEYRAAASGSQHVDVRLAQLRCLLGESGKRLGDAALRFLRLWVFDAEHSSTPPLIDVANFRQCRRMVGWPSCRLWLDAFKAKPGQIKLIDKDIDRPVLSITIKQNAP